MKKIIFTLPLLIFSIFTNVAMADIPYPTYTHLYPDVDFTHKYAEAIYRMTELDVFNGYGDGTFKPEKTINRAELVKILVEIEYQGHDKEYYVDKQCFPDIIPNEWYTKYVCFAKDKGQIHGYPDGTFRPDEEVNLVEAVKMYLSIRIYGHDIEQSDPWYKSYIEEAYYAIPHDFTNFDQSVTRAQMAQFLSRTRTDRTYMDLGVDFLWDNLVSYESLGNNVDMEAIARSTDHIRNAKYVQYEDYDEHGYVGILYSEDAELLSDEGVDDECYGGYYSGHFKFAIADTIDGEAHYLKGETDLGELRVPEDALHKLDTEMGPWMIIERYSTCTDSLFSIYEPGNNYYTLPWQVSFDDTEDDWFFADSVEDITFGDYTIDVIHNDKLKTYEETGYSRFGEFSPIEN